LVVVDETFSAGETCSSEFLVPSLRWNIGFISTVVLVSEPPARETTLVL
jgi:hypothetical protein